MKVAFFIRRIGPYHHARFKAVAVKMNLAVIETRPGSQEYPWVFEPGEVHYSNYSLGIAREPEKGFTGNILKQKVEDVLFEIKPDVVVTTGWADQEYHAVVLWAIRNKIPRIVISDSTQNDVRRNVLLEWIKKQVLRNYQAAIVAGSRSRFYLHQLGFKDQAIFHPWDVVDNDYFSKMAEKYIKEESLISYPYFLCVSRFVEKKNIPGLIKAFHIFKKETNSEHRLVILGSGELENEIKELITKLNLSDQVLLPGFKQVEDLPKYYAHAEALILPSFSDQWGLVVNEAMASGLPVLVSKNCGCIDDLVENGVNGFTFDPFEVDEIVASFQKFIQTNENKKLLMGEKSIELLGNFTVESFSSAVNKAVKEVISQPINEYMYSEFTLRVLNILR